MNTPLQLIISGIIIIALVALSAVCSGLNIALMSLKLSDLEHKAKLGDTAAIRVLPLRQQTHLSLASVLIANVAVISAVTLVLDKHLSGLLSELLSTALIVVFGEVVPQAIFLRHALKFCSALAPVMRLIIIVTYPASRPLAGLLDRLVGSQSQALQSRGELGLIIAEHEDNDNSELDDNEVDIIRGALSLSEKRVRDIMTPIAQVFWLTPDAMIDDQSIEDIKTRNYSRIPIFNRRLNTTEGVLLMKDLVDINFDDQSYRVSDLRVHHTKMVGSMTALDTLFAQFISAKSHLMAVEKDDKIIGVVTIEDLLEEIIGHEITDESDRGRVARPDPRS